MALKDNLARATARGLVPTPWEDPVLPALSPLRVPARPCPQRAPPSSVDLQAAALTVPVAPDPHVCLDSWFRIRFVPTASQSALEFSLRPKIRALGAVCFGSVRGCGRPGFTRPPDPAQIGEGAWRAFNANSRELELILKTRPWVQTESVDKLSIKVRVPWTIAFQAVSAVFRASSDASAVRISDCPAELLSS